MTETVSNYDVLAAKRATLVLKAAIDQLKDADAAAKCRDDMRALMRVIRFAESGFEKAE